MAVTASADHEVVDRRRLELVEPGVTAAPIHYESHRLDDAGTAALVEEVRASVARATSASLDELAAALPDPVVSISLRSWPLDFPTDIAVQRRTPYEARADAIMYRQVLAELAHARDWIVHFYSAKDVVGQAASILGEQADEVLQGPRTRLGPPWTKDQDGAGGDDRGRLNPPSGWNYEHPFARVRTCRRCCPQRCCPRGAGGAAADSAVGPGRATGAPGHDGLRGPAPGRRPPAGTVTRIKGPGATSLALAAGGVHDRGVVGGGHRPRGAGPRSGR